MQGPAGLRVVAPDAPDAWCEANEVMVSAICVNGASTSPVTAYANGAKCGYGDSNARARILCTPQAALQPPQDGSGAGIPDAGRQSAAQLGDGEPQTAGLRVVSEGNNVAQCAPDETLVSAYCTGSWRDYPLITYPGGRVKCGYGGGASQATAVCMPAAAAGTASAQGAASGLRVVASGETAAWCEPGETVVSAYCTGAGGKYPLQTYPNGAKCGYGGDAATATVVCSAQAGGEQGAQFAATGLRVVSGANTGACERNEVMVSAYCTGGWEDYPLLTYPGGAAKCGYSGGASELTLVCMAR